MSTVADPTTDLVFAPRSATRSHGSSAPAPLATGRDDRVRVEIGPQWQDGAASALLRGLHAARSARRPLAVRHGGGPGMTLLRAAQREQPDLQVDVSAAGEQPGAEVADLPRWQHHQLAGAALEAGAVVAITGGLGGIGLTLAAHFTARGHPVWLIDRRRVAALPLADQFRLAEAARHAEVTVSTWDPAQGGTPDRQQRVPVRVDHLVHAAGSFQPCPVADLGPDELERTAVEKAAGLRTAVAVLAPRGLRSVVVYGSSEARRPHQQFGAYALANEVARHEAHRLGAEHPDIRFVVAEWSLWADVGMAAALAGQAQHQGFATVAPWWGARVTESLLAPGTDQPPTLALGGGQSSSAYPLRVVPGVGGSSHRRGGAEVERLDRLCAVSTTRSPPRLGAVIPRTLVRATCDGSQVTMWPSAPASWAPAPPAPDPASWASGAGRAPVPHRG